MFIIYTLECRTFNQLTNLRRIKIHDNWCNGRYSEHRFCHHKMMYQSHILLEKDSFYITHCSELRCYQRSKNILETKRHISLSHPSKADITCFTKKDETIFVGCDDGHVVIYEDGEHTREKASKKRGLDFESINAVDFDGNYFITASKSSLNTWIKCYELDMISLMPNNEIEDVYKSVKISPDCNRFAAGKYIDREMAALEMHDMET